MRPFGILLIIISLLIPVIFFIPLAAKHDPIAMFSQYIGIAALIAMGITQILATRMVGLEPLFGGLDRIYVIHKWLGIAAMAFVLLHDTIDAEVDGLGRGTGLNDLAETLGEFSLYGLLILVMITIVTFIPYHLWRWTHKFMGAFFALSAFHYVFIMKPFDNFDPLGVYTLAFCIAGILAYIYTLLPEAMAHITKPYKVQSITPTGDAVSVVLEPEKSGIRHGAGQFAFVKFQVAGHNETHPFTISKAPSIDRKIRFTFKALGDDTQSLTRKLQIGTSAKLSTAFGHFRLRKTPKGQIWVAGGIGITPFVAWAQALSQEHGPVHLFYAVKSKAQAAHLEEFEAIASALDNFTFEIVASEEEGRLTAEKILSRTDIDIKHAHVAFCGPEKMREGLRKAFMAKGLRRSKFHFEEFEIRSGIGLRAMAAWLLQRTSFGKRLAQLIQA